jgi:glycosyltransferase involved in cell wall biosynthesis
MVSIIISSFNYARFLPHAIDSALSQTGPKVEVIVVDDGSTDGSRGVIEGYGARVQPIFKANTGQGSALNAGFARSRGDVVLFLDSDDVLLPGAAERVATMMSDPEVVKVHWPATEIDEAGAATGRTIPRMPLPRGDLRDQVIRQGPYGYHWPPTSANAWSRGLLARILPMPEPSFRTCPDLWLAGLAPLYGRVESEARPLSLWRKHRANFSWREDFSRRVREGIERDELTMSAIVQHGGRLGLVADRRAWQPDAWWSQIGGAIADIAAVVPEGGSFILADEDTWASGPRVVGRTRVPYLERDGAYMGPPADDHQAIAELERQRARGERFFVMAFPHLWYLEHYRGLGAWLASNARERLRSDRAVIFELSSGPAV